MSFSKKLIEQMEIKLNNRLNICSLDLVLLSLHAAKVCSNTLSPHSWKVHGLNPLVGCVEFAFVPCACTGFLQLPPTVQTHGCMWLVV